MDTMDMLAVIVGAVFGFAIACDLGFVSAILSRRVPSPSQLRCEEEIMAERRRAEEWRLDLRRSAEARLRELRRRAVP